MHPTELINLTSCFSPKRRWIINVNKVGFEKRILGKFGSAFEIGLFEKVGILKNAL